MKANSIHSQNPPSTTPPLSASQSTVNSTKRYNSITDSLNYFNIYGSTNELIPSSINYICIYTLVEDTGEDIYKQILYYGTEETFRFEAKGGDSRKRSDALSLDLFKKDETSKVSEERVDNSNDNKGGNSDIEDNEEDRGANLRPRHGTPIEIQERQVGLAQAIVNFSKTFSDTDISDNIHSQKHRLIIIEPEPKYFMVLSINLGQKLRNSNTQKGSLVVDYLDYELDDNLLKSWLTKSYQSFCIGHGDFSTIFNSQGKQSLVHNLEHFYDLYFSKHQSFTNLNLLKSLNKLELLYLSKSNYLYLKQIYNQLTSLNQRIDDSFIIFKGKLILNEFFTTNVSDPVIQYYSELFGEDFEFSEEMGHDGRNYGSVGGGNRQSMFQSWNPFKRYSTTSTSSTSVYSPNFQFLNLWDTTSADGDSEDSQYFKPQYLTNYDPKSPLQFNLQSKLMPETSSIVKKFYYNNGSEKLALIYSFAPHSYLVLTYNQDTSPYLTQGYFEDLERLLQPILNDTLVQLLQKDYELYQEQKGELTTKKLEFFYWNLLNNVKEINFTNTLINNDDFRLVIEVIDKLKSQKTTNDLIVRTISKKRTLTNWILGKRINNEESILILVVQRDSNIGDVEEEFRKLMNCYFNHLFLD